MAHDAFRQATIVHRVTFSCDGAGAHPREYFIGFTDHNLHISSSIRYFGTAKALELATRQRIVWVAVLRRVCLENNLFLPSFPIPDMSDLELERAAMAPRRWIELCCALQKQDNFNKMLPCYWHPLARTIKNAAVSVFIVPGGRYLVSVGDSLFVWDLGYVSTVDCKLVASVELKETSLFSMVRATPDGKGLVVLSSNTSHFSIFEIYPQSEMPLLTRTAHLDRFLSEVPAHLLPDTLISVVHHVLHRDWVVFKVVDYRTNKSTCFSVDVKNSEGHLKTTATKTAIIVFCKEGILIWAIPTLSPEPSDLRDHLFDFNPTHIPPRFKIPFPDGIICLTRTFITASSWYLGSRESDYFDILCTESKLQRCKIIIKPDLSDASLHVINMPEFMPNGYNLMRVPEGSRICEDALVYYWNHHAVTWGSYTGLTSAPFTSTVTRWEGQIHSLCPASGRFAYFTDDGDENLEIDRRIVVVDLF